MAAWAAAAGLQVENARSRPALLPLLQAEPAGRGRWFRLVGGGLQSATALPLGFSAVRCCRSAKARGIGKGWWDGVGQGGHRSPLKNSLPILAKARRITQKKRLARAPAASH